ncbi:MAG: phenylacetate-CoA oxygenase subunit PaaI, partial [Acidimicrobiales bacterium]|nr:phenylacetate-CoA oxygenase subunit PaaI [Acidimicrobiales bacterium]
MSNTLDALLRNRIQEGGLVESVAEMSDEYKRELRHIVTVSGDTELLSAPAYYYAARKAPSVNAMISAMAIIQDELSHAHIAYCILEDLGVSREWLMYEREPHEFRYPYAFDVPLDSWVELCVANAFYDQAGFCLLSDVHDNTSYGPWKRGLVKVGKEENFHLLHGRRWMKRIANSGDEGRQLVCDAVKWMFPMTVEWFGLPDDLKTHSSQLDYKMKGLTNDQLRQYWMDSIVPFCDELGLEGPVHRNANDTAW